MRRDYLCDKIPPSKFKVGRFTLNEYEARQMVARIAEGTIDPRHIRLTDEKGNSVTFDTDGTASNSIYNWDLGAKYAMRRFKAVRKRQKKDA